MRLDITPLRRYRDYRLLVSSATISLFGAVMTMVAVPLQVKQLTGCLMARLGGVRFSIGVGGLACLGGVAVVAALLPSFVRYDSRTDPHAEAERRRRAQARSDS
jgi:hypothetical protein